MSGIADTTVISNFASIGQLDLLRQLFGVLYISMEVYEETQAGIGEGYQFYMGIHQIIYPFVQDGWIRLTGLADEEEIRSLGQLPSRLHSGEASCLCCPTCSKRVRKPSRRLEKNWVAMPGGGLKS